MKKLRTVSYKGVLFQVLTVASDEKPVTVVRPLGGFKDIRGKAVRSGTDINDIRFSIKLAIHRCYMNMYGWIKADLKKRINQVNRLQAAEAVEWAKVYAKKYPPVKV